MSTDQLTRRASFRNTIEGILNSIDRLRAGEFHPIDRDVPVSPDLKVRFAVVCTPGTPRDRDNTRWDLILTDTPHRSPDYRFEPFNRVGVYWSNCEDREFLLGLANVGNAYLEISKPA